MLRVNDIQIWQRIHDHTAKSIKRLKDDIKQKSMGFEYKLKIVAVLTINY